MKALVLGIGADGLGSKRLLEREGAEVVIADDATAPLDTLPRDVELVVPRPGVTPRHPLLMQARRRGVPVWSEIEVAARAWTGRTVAVTGTNGKGSVVTMVTDALRRAGVPARAVGNIGDPMGSAVLEEPPTTTLVVEVSSFQLYYCHAFAPDAAAVLNAVADHLDWHESVAGYRRAKGRILRAQRRDAWAVVNAGDRGASALGRSAKARLCRYRQGRPLAAGLGLRGEWILAGEGAPGGGGEIARTRDLGLTLPHEVDNAMAVFALVRAIDPEAAAASVEAIRGFAGLPHMRQVVGEVGGVQFVDDSKATNPSAAAASVLGFQSVVLIAGGRSKGLSLAPMAEKARGRVRLVVAIGEAASEVVRVFEGEGIPCERAADMEDAVRRASRRACGGDTVLLAPGCASLDMFPGQAARGEAFAAAVSRLSPP